MFFCEFVCAIIQIFTIKDKYMKTNFKNQILHCVAISLLAQLFYQAPCWAQAPGGAPAAGGVVVEVVQNDPKFGMGESTTLNAETQAKNFLKERGLKLGQNKDKNGEPFSIVLGTSPILAGGEKFMSARDAAFDLAMLNAKTELAKFQGNTVATQLTSLIKNGTPGQLVTADGMNKAAVESGVPMKLLDKAMLIVNDIVNKELKSRGLNDQGAGFDKDNADAVKKQKAYQEDLKKKQLSLVQSQEFKKAASFLSRAESVGAQAYRVFEGKDEIAVIVVENKASRDLATVLIRGGVAPTGVPKMALDEWAQSLGDEVLLFAYGAQMRTDPSGEVVLVTFGQDTPVKEHKALANTAKKIARNNADISARQFLGEAVLATSNQETGFELKVYADREDEFEDAKKFQERIEATSKGLDIKGGEPVYKWSMKHPRSDVTTEGVVMSYSLSSAEAANALRDKLEAIKGSEGGSGVQSRPATKIPADTKKPSKPGSSSGQGPEGDLIDQPNAGGAGAPGRF